MNSPLRLVKKAFSFFNAFTEWQSRMRNTGFSVPCNNQSKNSMNTSKAVDFSIRINRISPLAEKAEIIFTRNHAPVVFTTGASLRGTQVVPEL